ncbi:MAG: sulfite exporter TauE/SafE family protein [Clostridiales bacterium]|nr:sulfite exporter TauE/SafE family protein [Clostridiales bacterium]
MIFWEILAGIFGGIVGGMGMGGGTLTIPILTIFLAYEQLQAQGINLIAFLPMSLVALFIHIKNHLVDYKSTWILALVGSVFSLGGALIANNISNTVLKKLFALFLIGLAIWQLIEMKRAKDELNQNNDENRK